jgi:hypothetical protein
LGARIPYVTGIGNHEAYVNYTAFESRFFMPGAQSGGWRNRWFSYDVGCVHVTSMSSEHDMEEGTPQYKWIDEDLRRARENGACWMLFMGHRVCFFFFYLLFLVLASKAHVLEF